MENMESATMADLTNDEKKGVWHTGLTEGEQRQVPDESAAAEEGGASFCKKKKIILLGWDRSRDYLFAGLSVAFIIWAAVFFPLILK